MRRYVINMVVVVWLRLYCQTVQQTYTNKDLICAATLPPYLSHTDVFNGLF